MEGIPLLKQELLPLSSIEKIMLLSATTGFVRNSKKTKSETATCRVFLTAYSTNRQMDPNCRPLFHPQTEEAPYRGDGPTDPVSVTDII